MEFSPRQPSAESQKEKAVFLYSLYTLRRGRGLAPPLLLLIRVGEGKQGCALLALDLGNQPLLDQRVQQSRRFLTGGQAQLLRHISGTHRLTLAEQVAAQRDLYVEKFAYCERNGKRDRESADKCGS